MTAETATAPPGKKIRVLVIDDSAFNRQTITQLLEQGLDIEVVGRAADGDEGLKLAFQLQPDVITLDLEMPKMDGFTFLRLLMAKRPTPVVVISGYATKENVFKALELGALDFVAKPSRQISPELRSIKDELIDKVHLVTQLRMVSLVDRARARGAEPAASTPSAPLQPIAGAPRTVARPPERVFAIGASTGGPPAIQQVLSSLEPSLPVAIIVTQHMPVKFTRAFAERLDRTTPWAVREAEEGDVLEAGTVLIAPGSGSLIVKKGGDGRFVVSIEPPAPTQRFTPSVNRMFEAAADAIGDKLIAVVLTGMGGDGALGVKAIKSKGGVTMAEAPETAVIFGMPQESIATGAVDEVVALGGVADAVRRLVVGGG